MTSNYEIFLDSTTCSVSQVKCEESRECIPSSYLCDGEVDCKDKSDESKHLCCKLIVVCFCLIFFSGQFWVEM